MALKAHLASSLTNPPQSDPQQIASGKGNRRQSRRTLTLETSGTMPDGAEANVTIHNISAAGLLLETDLTLGVGEVLAIELPDIGPVGAEIVWQSGHLFGCAFQQALGEAALAAAQLRGNWPGHDGAGPPVQARNQPQGFSLTPGDALGARLNHLRRERGMTLAQVASALGVSKPTVWAWEKGKARPLPERVAAIAKVLRVSESEFSDSSSQGAGAALVEECRTRIATAYGTSPKSVRIMIEV